MFTTDTWWSLALAGVTDADIQSYINDYGLTPEAPTDPKVIADLTAAKAKAAAAGDTKFENIFNKVLTYGDKILSILTKNGILENKNLAAQGYSIDLSNVAKDAATDSAPSTSSRVFNLDFSDPKTLIIAFLVVMILIYFLFFNPKSKNGKR